MDHPEHRSTMMQFLVFGVNFGNISRATRPPMDALVGEWNDRWKNSRSDARVVASYGHTGNFILELDQGGMLEGIRALQTVEPHKSFALFELDVFGDWLAAVRIAAKH